MTHAAAEKAGLKHVRQPSAAIAGLGGRCTMVESYYMVPVVDGDDKMKREGHGCGSHRNLDGRGRAD